MQVKEEWRTRLKALDPNADLRFNAAVQRWEFLLTCADGQVRSQFWCDFTAKRWERYTDPFTGKTAEHQVPDRDPVTGMMPFRPLNDLLFAEAMRNLERSFVGNPYDGAGSTKQETMRRFFHNRDLRNKKFQEAGNLFADMAWDLRHKLREDAVVGWTPGQDSPQAATNAVLRR